MNPMYLGSRWERESSDPVDCLVNSLNEYKRKKSNLEEKIEAMQKSMNYLSEDSPAYKELQAVVEKSQEDLHSLTLDMVNELRKAEKNI